MDWEDAAGGATQYQKMGLEDTFQISTNSTTDKLDKKHNLPVLMPTNISYLQIFLEMGLVENAGVVSGNG